MAKNTETIPFTIKGHFLALDFHTGQKITLDDGSRAVVATIKNIKINRTHIEINGRCRVIKSSLEAKNATDNSHLGIMTKIANCSLI